MHSELLRQDRALVSDVRPAIELRIAVENFAPGTVERHPDAVTVPRDRRHVRDHKNWCDRRRRSIGNRLARNRADATRVQKRGVD
jgi:hypothetical protein